MKIQLVTTMPVHREQFAMENFIGSDDIFALVKDGSFSVECEGERFLIQKNQGFLFRKGVLYYRRVLEPVTMYLFRYKSISRAFDRDHVIFRDIDRLATTFSLLKQLDSEVFKEDFEYRSHLFLDLVMQYSIENGKNEMVDEVIQTAIFKINQRIHHRDVKLVEIAAQTGLSYVQFLRRFKMVTGVAPSEYVATVRLQKAKNLLTDTDLLIKEIAFACGFENEYYFSNFFKKHTGTSPSAFRGVSV